MAGIAVLCPPADGFLPGQSLGGGGMERTPPWFDYDRDWLQPEVELDNQLDDDDEDEFFDRWQDDLAMARL